ncbi:hypothetical protein SY2F82_06680 [Streptomyces sp. Y2F8-2]|nr:hypothetical protein SY2F82_06680 [Streptomyces sp. Y2F8-2]
MARDYDSQLPESVAVRRCGRSVLPRFEGPGVPYAFVLGAEEVRAMPGDRARRTPLREPPVPLGPRTGPALYYPWPGTRGTCRGRRTSSGSFGT